MPSDGALTPRLAGLLVAAYTRSGDTIVDLSTDPALAGAAGAGARRYLSVTEPANLARLYHLTGSVGLIVVRWPSPKLVLDDLHDRDDLHDLYDVRNADAVQGADRGAPNAGPTGSSVGDLFTACRRLLAPDGCTILVLTPTSPGAAYVEHANVIIPAASRAGLGYLRHIVAVTAPLDRPTYPDPPQPPRPSDREEPRGEGGVGRSKTPDRAPMRPSATSPSPGDVAGVGHVDLLVFVLRGGRHE